MQFSLQFDERAVNDIDNSMSYYSQIEEGLEDSFFMDMTNRIQQLERNPFFQVRYANVRCLPLQTFPFMIHFTLDENNKLIKIRAIIHTRQSLDKWVK